MAELRAFIITPLANPALLRDLGLRGASGALLHGPPGCGKTSVARALAREVRGIANFLEVRCADLVDKVRWEGVLEERENSTTETHTETFPRTSGARGEV